MMDQKAALVLLIGVMVAGAVEGFDFVTYAFTFEELAHTAPSPYSLDGLFALSYQQGRTPCPRFMATDSRSRSGA